MTKPRGDVEISSAFYVLLLREILWDVYCTCGILYARILGDMGAYKIPHLHSQFPPNPTPTQLYRSTPSYLQIH